MLNYQKDKYLALRTKSEKTLRKLAKMYGYDKLPKKMNNVAYYGKRLSNFIEEKQYSNYQEGVKEKNKVRKSKQSKQPSLTQLIKEMKKTYKQYVNTLPDIYRMSEVFMNYFTKGHSLKTDSHDIDTWGKDFTVKNTVKEMMDYYQTNDKEKLKKLIKSQIDEMKNNNYNVQVKDLKNKALKEVNRLQQELNDGNYSPQAEAIRNMVKDGNMMYHELLELNQLLENNGNVFDSIYSNDTVGGGQHDFDLTLEIMRKKCKQYNIEQYKN